MSSTNEDNRLPKMMGQMVKALTPALSQNLGEGNLERSDRRGKGLVGPCRINYRIVSSQKQNQKEPARLSWLFVFL
jgi:hypothetical protein